MKFTGRNNLAVVQRRVEPADSLDFFPTPPWATRALFEHVILRTKILEHTIGAGRLARDPCCGEGHMAAVLAEYCEAVTASDIHPYGFGAVADYRLFEPAQGAVDWVFINPPFKTAADFLDTALRDAQHGVAMLARSNWKHGPGRYKRFFRDRPPRVIAPFVERVPMVKGRWDPNAKTMTEYSWFVWTRDEALGWTPRDGTREVWIPPGCRKALTRREDFERFAAKSAAPLLEEA